MKKHQSKADYCPFSVAKERLEERLRKIGYGPLGPHLTNQFHQHVIMPDTLAQLESQELERELWRLNLRTTLVL